MTSGFTQFSAVVGRRTALRYGTIGACAAAIGLLTGCGSTSPVAATLAAFANGTWEVTTKGKTGAVTVADGTWTADADALPISSSGTWSLAGSTLSVVQAGMDGSNGQCAGTGMPQTVGGSLNQTIGWVAHQFSVQLPVSWDGTTLTMTGEDSENSPMVITATRH